MRLKMNKRTAVIAAAIAGVFAVAGGGAYIAGGLKSSAAASADAAASTPEGPPPAVVQIAEAVEARLSPFSEAPGSVVSLRDSLVAAATSGKIEWVAEVGAELEEGDIIARIDPADATFARDEARAEMRRLKSRADYLSELYERFAGLGDESGESEASLDEMRANRDEALQNLARAQVSLERAEINLQRTEVRAPFAGRIVTLEIQIGEYAAPGAAIARVTDTRHLEVTAQAPAALLRSVKPGDRITLAYNSESVTAPVRAIVPVGDQRSRTLELRISLDDSDWPIGSAVRVSLPTRAPKTVVAAPRDALVLRANRVSVFVIDEEMKAKRVDVELGVAEGDLIEVIGEVEAGDKLVIRGGERLREGQSVTISQIAVADAAV
jgi:RND family efflux transporter MFP subunit